MDSIQNNPIGPPSLKSTISKHPPGSLRELVKISFPIMLMALSWNMMYFFDRLILAQYSVEAMNSAAAAAMIANIFQLSMFAIASIAEVFVGQYNGAGQLKKMASPSWQMIWLSVFSWVVFLPVAFWGRDYLLAEEFQQHGRSYFLWVMAFGPFLPLTGALGSFFIGQGKVILISTLTIAVNVINILLDYVLVFGIEGIVPSMGTKGAAIATIFAQLFQIIILFFVFLNKKNRLKFGTSNFKFNWRKLKSYLKVGLPNAISHAFEMGAWASIYPILAWNNAQYVSIFIVGQNVMFISAFLSEGMQKGVIAIASNILGAKQNEALRRLLFSAIKLHLIIVALVAIPLLVYPEVLVNAFLHKLKDIGEIDSDSIYQASTITLTWVWIYVFIDGFVWMIAGILTAAEDTKFLMIINAMTAWFMAVLPIYLFLVILKMNPSILWILMNFYTVANLGCFLWRYKSNLWKKI